MAAADVELAFDDGDDLLDVDEAPATNLPRGFSSGMLKIAAVQDDKRVDAKAAEEQTARGVDIELTLVIDGEIGTIKRSFGQSMDVTQVKHALAQEFPSLNASNMVLSADGSPLLDVLSLVDIDGIGQKEIIVASTAPADE